MLSSISIKNYLYIKNIHIEFDRGLNIFTGETGVGKSLIIDAIEFALGKRGNYKENTCVEVIFENLENDYADEGTLIISREIKNGKSIYYLNGRRATRSTIIEATENIVEIHSQHHQQKLFRQSYYRETLDKYARLETLLKEYQRVYDRYIFLKEKEKEIIQKQSERLREIDILKFQLREIEEADIKEGEKEDLEKKFQYLSQIQSIKEVVYNCEFTISEKEESILSELSNVIKSLERIKDASPLLEEVYTNLLDAKVLIQESQYNLSHMNLDFDPEEYRTIEERLNLINKLELKYNTDEKGLIELKEEFKKRIEYLENLEYQLPDIQKNLKEISNKLRELSEEISKVRKEKGRELEEKIKEHLKELGLKEAEFVVHIEEKQLDRYGKDRITFLFSANRGYPPSPLGDIASGGELSRISLSLKLITGSDVNCLIFDEIDTGLGGKTALLLAEKLKTLSENYQIILITHLPQIAVYADKHFFIDKQFKDNKTEAVIKVLSTEKRMEEIARMLTGSTDEKALELARKLLERAKIR